MCREPAKVAKYVPPCGGGLFHARGTQYADYGTVYLWHLM
jgi:hypothetical protein